MEKVIRKIRPGHPEDSKTMSFEEAVAECDKMIAEGRRSIRTINVMIGVSVFGVLALIIATAADFGTWLYLVSGICLLVSACWGFWLNRCLNRFVERNKSNQVYFNEKIREEKLESESKNNP